MLYAVEERSRTSNYLMCIILYCVSPTETRFIETAVTSWIGI